MPAITLQIMVNAPTHPLDTPEKEAYRYRNGDPIQLYMSDDIATWSGTEYLMSPAPTHPRFLYFHITEVPDRLIPNVRRLCERHSVANEKYRKRRFRIPPAVMAPVALSRILSDRQMTFNWQAAKQLIRKKLVTNIADSSTDDETTRLQDGDLE